MLRREYPPLKLGFFLPGMITILLSCITFLNLPPTILGHGRSPSKLQTRQIVVRPNALRNFEIREPPVVPRSKACDQLLLKYNFANSYGKPGNASYLPPKDCGQPGDWASVIFNLTITSIGKQYDRLGRLYLNDIESRFYSVEACSHKTDFFRLTGFLT
ncbi:hypothetical protein PGT21_007926 [Puccinia graminis f. sp. tritici]|uniref:Peptide N-acetyl-beta-D-glucosaminyl asparaginase amidase A N-terminal domain-containing protein n=1 Tax=Puccinia graminis f. sp. tritici TaxID=56615 RepID=A0A5B0QMM0_PUCGR|nr:hypothetical protein PGT21_007926 [Puccinia graminis f. sp. tritici]